jgi:hypothetical protein
VPFDEKDQAKAAGARWDPTAKRWYDPRPGGPGQARPALQTWVPLPEVPDLLPGEDREFGQGLFLDPVPESCWFTNVRILWNLISPDTDRLTGIGAVALRYAHAAQPDRGDT